TTILGKIGIQDIESNLGTAIRTSVVLVMAWLVVLVSHKNNEIKKIKRNELLFICLSGVATGCSWLCYYRGLQLGPASLVAPIDRLSIVVTVLFSVIVFKEKLSKKSLLGLIVLIIGTLVMLL
ncbi:EamA family transporter, partial [uncultured Thomasclavelia sp.]|uniref:EamA family transporter n=1 Tax=uncultured Thomasclavelia sp. TaxID=3025759 RepID=UPI0025FCE14A